MLRTLAWIVAATVPAMASPTEPPTPEPFSVVELFTSEGCSSCPPADRVMGDVVANATKEGTRVFALAFHIDYWDNLGWKDPYASAAATRRQREYAAAREGSGVYTPQMIVNGTEEFVGSDSARAKAAIAAALKEKAVVGVAASAMQAGDRARVQINIAPGSTQEGRVLVVALVQRGLSCRVKAGENAGRMLTHENVVRDFEVKPMAPSAAAELRIPDGAKIADLAVIAYVQDSVTRRILGATAAKVSLAP